MVTYPLAKLAPESRDFALSRTAVVVSPQPAPTEWPELIGLREEPEVEIIREDLEAKSFVYESANFRYTADARLSKSVTRRFARLFEATLAYCKALPLGLGEGTRTDGKFAIRLYENTSDYFASGGPPGTGGVFTTGENIIKVPFESLGLRKAGSGYTLDHDVSNRTLAHEIVHQLTPPSYFCGASFNSWFIEGIAEYVANTPYRSGQYNTRTARAAIIEYATGFSREDKRGRNIGKEIHLDSLDSFFHLPYSAFTGQNANFHYAVSPLLVHYFIHADGPGDGSLLRAYLEALRSGSGHSQATQALLNGRSFRDVETTLQTSFRRYGLKFTFGNRDSESGK